MVGGGTSNNNNYKDDIIWNIGYKEMNAIMGNVRNITCSNDVDLDVNSSNMSDKIDSINSCVNMVDFNNNVEIIVVHTNNFKDNTFESNGGKVVEGGTSNNNNYKDDTICNIGDKETKVIMGNIRNITRSKGIDLDVNSSNMFVETDTINSCVNMVDFNNKVENITVYNNNFNILPSNLIMEMMLRKVLLF